MKKLSVKWSPDLKQDLDAVINPNSPFYLEEFTNDIIKVYGSLESFKNSEDYKDINSRINKENFLKLVSPEKCDTMDKVKDRILRRPEIRKQQEEAIAKLRAENWVTCIDCNWEGDIGECNWDSEPDVFSGNDRKYPICPKCEGGIE